MVLREQRNCTRCLVGANGCCSMKQGCDEYSKFLFSAVFWVLPCWDFLPRLLGASVRFPGFLWKRDTVSSPLHLLFCTRNCQILHNVMPLLVASESCTENMQFCTGIVIVLPSLRMFTGKMTVKLLRNLANIHTRHLDGAPPPPVVSFQGSKAMRFTSLLKSSWNIRKKSLNRQKETYKREAQLLNSTSQAGGQNLQLPGGKLSQL